MSKSVYVGVDCFYCVPLIVKSLERRCQEHNWKLLTKDNNDDIHDDSIFFAWCEYEDVDWDKACAGKIKTNNYCVRKGLIRKGNMAINLHKYRCKHPESLIHTHVPETSIIDCDDADYLDEALYDAPEVAYMKENEERFILKPSIVNQAGAICVFTNLQELEEAIRQEPDLREWVIQRYIERPLLVEERKFHLRVYVLAVNDVNVYLFNDILVLLASQKYNAEDHKNVFAHLTNTCLQEKREDFKYEDCVKTLTELPDLVGVPGIDQDILVTLHKLTGEIFAAVSAELNYQPLENCFELYGLDFMLDEDHKVYFLEANATPDLKMTGGRLKNLVENLIEETCEIVLDEKVETEHFTKIFSREKKPF